MNILCVEDNEADFCLVVRHLTENGINANCQRVDILQDFTARLQDTLWNLVLLDYGVPGINIPQVLKQLQQYSLDIPVILVSGSIGEEVAIDLLKLGVSDFVLKGNLTRLGPAIDRCLHAAVERQARREAEANLKRNERLISAIIEGSTDAIFVKDCDGRYLLCNTATARFVGRTKEEIIGQDDFFMFPPAVAQQVRLLDLSVMESGCTQTHEESLATLRGEQITFLVTKGPIFDSDGNVFGLFGISRNITERKIMEDALRDSDERAKQILNTAPSAMIVANSLGNIVHANAKAYQLFLYPEGQLLGQKIESLIVTRFHSKYRAMTASSLAASGTRMTGEQGELYALRFDGSEFPAEIGMGSVCLARDQHFIVNITDITDRKQAESLQRESEEALLQSKLRLEALVNERTAELREQAGYLRALIDHFPFLVWLKDTQGRYLAGNQTSPDPSGKIQSVKKCIGKTDADIWNATLTKQYEAEDAKVMTTRQPILIEESFPSLNQNVWREIYKAPVVDEHGVLLGTVGFSRDISDRKATEAARENALREAERLAQVRSDFLANMSHEIRTPLNAILGFTQVGLRDSKGRQIYHTFSHIMKSGKHLLGVINDILDFSKIEAGKLAIEQRRFVLNDVLDNTIELVASQAYAKDIDFQINEAPDLPEIVLGDPARIEQVLANLLSNAVKFTANGNITLVINHTASALVFQVQDTGIGISVEALSQLFQPFVQADGSTSRRFGGTGLGLVICKRLVELMGGSIQATSQPGVGSIFEVSIPLHRVSASTLAPVSGSIVLAGLPTYEAEKLAATLQQRGVSIVITTLHHAFATDADLVVLDHRLLSEPSVREAIDCAVTQSKKVALICVPGADVTDLERYGERIRLLERPVRGSQILKTMLSPQSDRVRLSRRRRLTGFAILAVEDEEVNRMVLQELVGAEGAQLVIVSGGQSAIDRLMVDGPQTYDVVLMDIQMPEMDGYEATRRIRKLAPKLPVIGLTAHAMAEERKLCLEAGMVAHMTKPVELDTLVTTIHAHVLPHSLPSTKTPGSAATATLSEHSAANLEHLSAIDWVALESRFCGKQEFVRKLCNSLLSSHGDTAANIRDAAQREDFTLLASLAHSLNGVSANLMAMAVHALAVELESAAQARQLHAGSLAEQLAKALDELLAATVNYLNTGA